MTGVHLEGTPTTIEDRQAELEALHKEVFGKPQAPPKSPGPSPTLNFADSEIIEKARNAQNGNKFDRLMGGGTSEHDGDDNRADLALCSILAFWTQDPGQIDRIFRTSGLYRDKWDSRRGDSTYGHKTIEKALAGMTEFYTPGKSQYQPQPPPADDGQDYDQAEREAIQGEAQTPKFPDVISAADLQNIVFPEIEYIVQGIIPFGFGLLSARPKKGKSFLALNVSAAKSTGGRAFGKKELRLELGTVLYIVGLILTDITYTMVDPRVRLK